MAKATEVCTDQDDKTRNTGMFTLQNVCNFYGTIPSPCTVGAVSPILTEWPKLPEAILAASYSCCAPSIPQGVFDGMTVIDLGCGAGRDLCYLATLGCKRIVGIDACSPLLEIARRHAAPYIHSLPHHPEIFLIEGSLENLHSLIRSSASSKSGINGTTTELETEPVNAQNEIESNLEWKPDLCVSNCVVNLCVDKAKILAEVWKVLKEGGEFCFSDIYANRRLDSTKLNEMLHISGLAGSLYWRDFILLCNQVGFLDIRMSSLSIHPISAENRHKLGEGTTYFAITLRLFKISNLEKSREDYGHTATYLGGIRSSPEAFQFDLHYIFARNQPLSVDQNLANVLSTSWLSRYFRVEQGKQALTLGIPSNPKEVMTQQSAFLHELA
ncbi:putative Arsenite methyltransferase [Cardiosporidium cionae]|uniref:Arsenite methyltransferase n=1 Tax=Cardiosporidium cionae TaxID=476202 RepID=A0ABQ7JD35_9APIC|nr:putative Arsenite methyltransferase [Cardiosporidium cionae]|eukprot:KAF8821869.1 putative Arsenite methyltransferase [Cardiosporidium cionae]